MNVIDALRLMLSPDDDDERLADGRSEPLEFTLTTVQECHPTGT